MGLALATGRSADEIASEIGQVVEGVYAAKSVYEVAARENIEMPICEQVYLILYAGATPADAVTATDESCVEIGSVTFRIQSQVRAFIIGTPAAATPRRLLLPLHSTDSNCGCPAALEFSKLVEAGKDSRTSVGKPRVSGPNRNRIAFGIIVIAIRRPATRRNRQQPRAAQLAQTPVAMFRAR